MDDIFGDLVPKKAVLTESKSAVDRGPRSTPRPEVPDVFTPEANEEAVQKHNTAESTSSPVANRDAVFSFSKEQLRDLLDETVQKAVESTFSKLVRSLRTVLEDMSKRIDANTAAHVELKASVSDLSELIVGQASNTNSRFTSVDQALRDVDRGVQALRDKQELHEAQAMLAKYSDPLPSTAAAAAATGDKKTPPAVSALSGDAAAVPVAPLPVAASTASAAPAAAPLMPIPVAAVPAPVPSAPPSVQQQQYHQQPSPSAYPQQLQGAPPPPPQPEQPAVPPLSLPAGYVTPAPSSYLQAPPPQGPPLGPQASDPYQQQQQPLQYQAPLQQQPPPHQQMAPQTAAYGTPQPPMQYAPPSQMQQPPVRSPMPQGPPPMPLPQSYPAPSMPAYPAPLMAQQSQPSFSGGGYRAPQAGPPPPSMQSGPPKTSSRAVPLEQIIADIAQMGFERHQVMAVVNNLQKNGQAVDLNVILDKLTRGDYR